MAKRDSETVHRSISESVEPLTAIDEHDYQVEEYETTMVCFLYLFYLFYFEKYYNFVIDISLLHKTLSEKFVGNTELRYSTKKRHHVLGILKSCFGPTLIRVWEYESSDSDRKVNRNISPDADTRDMMNNASIWPYGWPISTYSPLFT